MSRGIRLGLASVVAVMAGAVTPARAQIPLAQQQCISAFNKSIRSIAKTQASVVKKCMKDFANGRLVGITLEDCLIGDPLGKVAKAIAKATASAADRCNGVTPLFGTTPMGSASTRAAIVDIELMHGAISQNLDISMIPSAAGAACQMLVTNQLSRCNDVRRVEFLKCLKTGMRSGVITDAASLQAICLGSGSSTQPDPTGKIAKMCDARLATTLLQRCTGVPLTTAFPPCGAAPGGSAACLADEAACQLCQLMNDVAGTNRDCDAFDDGNPANGTCGKECGDGVVQVGEACDDGDLTNGDGCTSACTVESGWSCTGSPSVCTPSCGNGAIEAGESCDDGDASNGDGCSNACVVETGWTCTGTPSVCTPSCGNGIVAPGQGEACDDGDRTGGDGCSATCQVEAGYACTGQPSVCTFVCGNGTFQAGESCDDGDATGGDGCSSTCQIEAGWLCSGVPSICNPLCGDGVMRGGETCDDGDVTNGDGCSLACQVEAGYSCAGTPSNCLPVCGDGFIRGLETCDDGNNFSGDGCSGNGICREEALYTCVGQPSVCTFNCGDGNLDDFETCDDGNNTNGDGCTATCQQQAGYSCGGEPSLCILSCGNGAITGAETCDDGNATAGDGCSANCRNESGWLCPSAGLPCIKYDLFIDTPAHGTFTTASSVVITGHYTQLPAGTVAITVNGVPASSVNQVARTFSHTVALSAATINNPIKVTLTNTANGDDVHARIVVIRGESVADGAYSPQSVAMRINDSGLDAMEPLVAQLAASGLNLGTLLPPGTVLADDCFINAIGCWGSAVVKIGNPAPSYSSVSFTADSKVNVVAANITVHNLRVDVDIDGSGLVPDCGLRLTAATMPLTGDYAMQPDAADPSNIDVNLVTPIGVTFGGFNYTFTYGLCDAPIIGDIIQSLLPDIEDFAVNGIKGFLSDPDGSGPGDSPIAEGIETALAGISITGPIGAGLGLQLSSPLFTVAEDNSGITFGSDSRFTVSVGTGPGQCIPPPGAPNLTASYSKPEAFPSFGPNTPVGNDPYGLGICISSAGFNQLLRGQTECGLMRTSLSTIDLDGPGGAPPLPITAGLLSVLVPEFSVLPPGTALRVDVAPTLAPIVTGANGPSGELTELKIAQVAVQIVEPGSGTVWLGGAFDARLGMNLAFLPDGSGLSVTLTEPAEADTTMVVIYNPLGTNEATLETLLPGIIRPLIPSLAGALSGFPLPQFFGFQLAGVEVSRNGAFLALFANLEPAP